MLEAAARTAHRFAEGAECTDLRLDCGAVVRIGCQRMSESWLFLNDEREQRLAVGKGGECESLRRFGKGAGGFEVRQLCAATSANSFTPPAL